MENRLIITGRAFSGGSSRAQDATLHVGASNRLELIVDDQVVSSAGLNAVNIDPPLGRSARRMTFPDGTLFETTDFDGVTQLTGETRGGLLHRLESYRPRLLGVIAASVVGVWVLWRYGLDILTGVAVAMTPNVFIEQLDRGTLSTIDFTMASPTKLEQAEKDRIRDILERMVSKMPQDAKGQTEFNLLFRSMPSVGPNAFAMPGGTIVMTDQFVEKFSDDDVLAAVLGHELGHVVEQHGLRQIYRSLSIYVLVAFLVGDTGPVLEDIVLEGNLLLSLNYSRKHERAADQLGLKLSRDAGFDPAGLKKFFEYVVELEGDAPEWLSSHPSSAERLEAIDAFINQLN
jgi:Zn-dependent protease with chaperone function